MRTLAVMAHYDAGGQLAPHALRNAQALSQVADRLVVVSTAGLGPAQAAPLHEVGELVSRENYGYDFYSWKVGLASVEDLASYDLVVIANDSYVGPVVPYARILAAMAVAPSDFWGLTSSDRRSPHVQSFFVAFRGWVARSAAFHRFWSTMTPVSDRGRVIREYEIGLSRSLLEGGFGFSSYFRETAADVRIARLRHLWWARRRALGAPPGQRKAVAVRFAGEPWNPVTALADRVLDGGRLPIMKLDTLRYDPYQLGADRLLRLSEQAYPHEFAGVRGFLERTAAIYPLRDYDPGPGDVPPGLRGTLGYHR